MQAAIIAHVVCRIGRVVAMIIAGVVARSVVTATTAPVISTTAAMTTAPAVVPASVAAMTTATATVASAAAAMTATTVSAAAVTATTMATTAVASATPTAIFGISQITHGACVVQSGSRCQYQCQDQKTQAAHINLLKSPTPQA